MEEKIRWETDYGSALKKAQIEKKAILLDFFSPG